MSTKSRKRKSQKAVKESKLKPESTHDTVDSHDLPMSDATPVSQLSTGASLNSKITGKMSTKQSVGGPTNDIDPVSTLEDDIRWCIAQLEMAAVSKNVTKKQKEESVKYIKLLQSSKTPVPRKRQIMRQNFGDYKQKMRERPLTDSDVTLKVADSELRESAGRFHRKSTKYQQTNSCVSDEQGAVGGSSEHSDSHALRNLCKELEGAPFKFDFSID